MSPPVTIEIDLLEHLRLPCGVDQRLQALLARRDHRQLTAAEQSEVEGLVDLAELLSLLRLRARRLTD